VTPCGPGTPEQTTTTRRGGAEAECEKNGAEANDARCCQKVTGDLKITVIEEAE